MRWRKRDEDNNKRDHEENKREGRHGTMGREPRTPNPPKSRALILRYFALDAFG